MSTLTDHLVRFARDQLAVIKGWQGETYVDACLKLWADAYGQAVADEVRRQLKADK